MYSASAKMESVLSALNFSVCFLRGQLTNLYMHFQILFQVESFHPHKFFKDLFLLITFYTKHEWALNVTNLQNEVYNELKLYTS